MCKKAMSSEAGAGAGAGKKILGAGAAPKQIGSETLPEITMTYDTKILSTFLNLYPQHE